MLPTNTTSVSINTPFVVNPHSVSKQESVRLPPRPLNVCFVITSMPVGGAETLLVNLIDRLDPSRCVAEVVCLKSPGVLGEQIQHRVPLHAQLLTSKWDLRVLFRLSRLFKSRKTDAVITVGSGDKMFWGRLAARCAGVPVVCSAIHSTGWPDGINGLNRLLTPLTDRFIAVADAHAEFLRDRERLGDDRVVTIRNGIDTDRFRPNPCARQDVRRELGIALDAPLVGIVAALRPEKNHTMFVDVAAALRQQRQEKGQALPHFAIIGDGPSRPEIEAHIAELGIQPFVHLLGTRYDTPRLLAALDVFTLCSHNEASPVSILEALACEVPVVSTDVGSVRESVQMGVTGFTVPPGSVTEFTACVSTLLNDAGLAKRCGASGRKLVQETGSLDSMVEGYQSLIETLYDRNTTR